MIPKALPMRASGPGPRSFTKAGGGPLKRRSTLDGLRSSGKVVKVTIGQAPALVAAAVEITPAEAYLLLARYNDAIAKINLALRVAAAIPGAAQAGIAEAAARFDSFSESGPVLDLIARVQDAIATGASRYVDGSQMTAFDAMMDAADDAARVAQAFQVPGPDIAAVAAQITPAALPSARPADDDDSTALWLLGGAAALIAGVAFFG